MGVEYKCLDIKILYIKEVTFMSVIIKDYKAKQVMEGAGVLVNRVFGNHDTHEFDPFLMLDYFNIEKDMDSPGFPWHPHKGIETITYFLKGSGLHEDSIGNKGVIGAGELQWMSSGKGIYHQEMLAASPDGIQGFQFWVNLPAKDKLKNPDYQYIKQGEMKSVIKEQHEVRVISGKFGEVIGPIDKSNLGITMLHVSLKEGKSIDLLRDEDKQGFIFLFEGEGSINKEPISEVSAYTLKPGKLNIEAGKGKPMEFIFAQGLPLKEPIAWRGPIVMNTDEQIYEAFKDLSNGTFIK